MTIWFDMDGTIADLYGVDGWLDMLQEENPAPYLMAEPMLNFSQFARLLHKVQRYGMEIGIISWTSRNSSEWYEAQVAEAKMKWLADHLPSVVWDEIKIVPYGTSKIDICGGGILFDDEARNRNAWGENAFDPHDIVEILKSLM